MKSRLLTTICAALILTAIAPAPAQDADPNLADRAAQAVRETVQRFAVSKSLLTNGPAVWVAFRDVVAGPNEFTVRVKCDDKHAALGCIVGEEGWIITKASELKGEISCVLFGGREVPAKLVGVNKEHDIAMLKVETDGLTAAKFNANVPEVGRWVAAPAMVADPAAVGVVSVAWREILRSAGVLGILLEPAEGGVRVGEVVKRSGAERAGIEKDDLVTHCNGKKTPRPEILVGIVRKHAPGEQIELTIRRGEETKKIKATLSDAVEGMPHNRANFQSSMGTKLSNRRNGFPRAFGHDAALRPIDCGGPLVNLDGEVVGINIARAGRTKTYAIPSKMVKSLLPDLKSGKMAPK